MEKQKASITLRILAGFIDLVILVLFINASYFLMKWSVGWWLVKIPGLGPLLYGFIKASISLTLPFIYLTYTEASPTRATPGKLLCGLKVQDSLGQRLSIMRSSFRSLGKIVSSIPFCLGFWMILFTESRKALHDVFAETDVVEDGPIHPIIDSLLVYLPDLDEFFRN